MQCQQLLCGEVTTSQLSLGRFCIISLMLCLVQDKGKKIPVLEKWRQTIKSNKVNTLYGIWINYFSCLILHFYGDNTQFGVNVLFKTNWQKIWVFCLFLPIPKFTFSLPALCSYCSNVVIYCFILESHFSLYIAKSLV